MTTRRVPIYQVDAFSEAAFSGNPAAVLPDASSHSDPAAWMPDEILLAIAAENNLTETAFMLTRADGEYDLRWFTPTLEVDMCGHATLASGAVALTILHPEQADVGFHTRSGRLVVRRAPNCPVTDCQCYTLDFPVWPVGNAVEPPPKLVHALGGWRPRTKQPVVPDVLFEQIDTDRSDSIDRGELKEYLTKVGDADLLNAAPWPIEVHEVAPLHGAPYFLFLYANEADVRALDPIFAEMDANVVATAAADVAADGEEQFDVCSRSKPLPPEPAPTSVPKISRSDERPCADSLSRAGSGRSRGSQRIRSRAALIQRLRPSGQSVWASVQWSRDKPRSVGALCA